MPLPRLTAISDRDARGDLSLLDWLAMLRDAGVDTVQLREKDLDDRALFDLALEVREHWPSPRLLIVNGRVDVALAAEADGVHLPSHEIPTAVLASKFGDRLLIGRSTHHPDEVRDQAEQGADWVSFGPIFETPSKIGMGDPPGVDGLREAVEAAGDRLRVVALGGLTTPNRLQSICAAGAGGVAGIRAFHDSERLASLIAAWTPPSSENS